MTTSFDVTIHYAGKNYHFCAADIRRNTTDGAGNHLLHVLARDDDGERYVINMTPDWKIRSIIG